MSCGTKTRGNFSSQQNTYSCKSDLTMANWDPYPELQNPKNCYGANYEPYCPSDRCLSYKSTPNNLDSMSSYAPLQKSRVVNFTPVSKEKYCNGCDPNPYDTLGMTWNTQGPYSLAPQQGSNNSKEKYCNGCDANPYDTLAMTWTDQGPYRT